MRLLDMQFTRFAIETHAVPIIQAIGGIRILLNLQDE